MRGMGIGALALTLVSFIFWLASWLYFTFLATRLGYESPLRYVVQAFGMLASLTEYLAIALIAVGLILAAKNLPKG